ncbi:MAG: hypothetical protein HN536_02545 [Candidatus Marinimicrobia bacterium]|nr:hypothetical protein [Candidatus Neomarinimicrobiota bacterium]
MASTLITKDFYLAATLLCGGMSLTGHTREFDRSEFQFEGSDLNSYVSNYFLDEITISPLKFCKAIRDLKTIMYNETSFQPIQQNAMQRNMDSKSPI